MMTINEDYFKDIDITDDVIMSNDDNVFVDDTSDSKKPIEWFDYYKSHYTSSIVFHIQSYGHIDSLCANINDFAKKIYYMLEQYNIEYSEIIIRDNSLCNNNNLQMFNVSGFKFFSTRDLFDVNGNLNSDYFMNHQMYAVIYTNFPEYPDFSYKRAYSFTQNLIYLTWNKSRFFTNVIWIKITRPAFYINGFALRGSWTDTIKMEKDDLHNLQDTELIDGKIKNYLKLFKDTMIYFFGECDDVFNMVKKMRRDKNPFK